MAISENFRKLHSMDIICCCFLWSLSCVWLFATPWTVACQTPLSMEILQARILEWVATSFSKGSSPPRYQSLVSCIGRWQFQDGRSKGMGTEWDQEVVGKVDAYNLMVPRSLCSACCCLIVQSCLTLCNPMGCDLPSSSCPWDFPGKNTGVGCHFLLQGIFLTQEFNPHLCISCITGEFFTTELLGSPLVLGYHLSNHNKLQIPIMQRIIKNSNIYLRSNFC